MKLFGFEIRRAKDFSTLLSSVFSTRGGWWPVVHEPYTGAWQRNEQVSTETTLSNPTLYSCITLIASDIGKMGLLLVEKDRDGIWNEFESPAFSPFLRKPNRYQTRVKFFEWWLISKLVHGNTYVLKARDQRGVVVAGYILDPCRVKVLMAPDGSVFYELKEDELSGLDNEEPIVVPAREIFHDVMCPLFHPLVGVTPIFAAGYPALLARNMLTNAGQFFTNSSRPGGVLTAPGSISQDTALRLKTHWETEFSGDNAGKIAVLGDGLTYQATESASAVDLQLIEQLRWTDEQIAKCFHMPPHKVGVGPMPTYNNIEALNQQYYSDCLQTLVEALEAVLDDGLGLGPSFGNQYGVSFDLDDLLRMDSATMMDTATKGVVGGIYKPNEARKKFNMRPVKGGDTPYLQQQNFSLFALDARDQMGPAPSPSTTPAQPQLPAPDDDGEDVADADLDKLAGALMVKEFEATPLLMGDL